MSTFLDDDRLGSALEQVWGFDLERFALGRFAQLVVERALDHLGAAHWSTDRESLKPLSERMLTTQRGPGWSAAVIDLGDVVEGCIAFVSLRRGTFHVRVAGQEAEDLAVAQTWLRERFPVLKPSEEQRVWITFWSLGPHGARELMRKIDVPTWAEVSGNYPAAVVARLVPIMCGEFVPGRGGRLVLWHGPPGTGKTFALRALAWEWRSWCDFHYVTDPESFFGSSPSYMLDVLLDEDSEDDDRWRLLILEDTGELLAADAKERTGQGLSRLLNTVDGLIGQGLRVLVLVTTNESLKSLHLAVSRPGRCASQIEFAAFTPEEAADWLAHRGAGGRKGAATLASLYAGEAGIETPEPRRIGFVQ